MHIGIIGTRGIPNNYGGFEQCAEFLSIGLVKKGFRVTVYNSHNHPFQGKEWNGVKIIHCYDPENNLGTVGQFIYDLNCILNCRSQNFDIILQLGYTSSSIWGGLLPRKNSIVTTNMDGLEWKRSKYSFPVRKFLQIAEKLGVKYSDHLISDSLGIQKYIKDKYKRNSTYIAYGANIFDNYDIDILNEYELKPYKYNMLIARLEPENSIETILNAIVVSNHKSPFLVIGNHNTKFGTYLKNKFLSNSNIKFIGGIYDLNKLNNLRYFSQLYFHGHTVGGTNPSLLEAMGSNALICAQNNIFNKSILGEDAYYFDTARDIVNILDQFKTITKGDQINVDKVINNLQKVKSKYSWDHIVNNYIQHFRSIYIH